MIIRSRRDRFVIIGGLFLELFLLEILIKHLLAHTAIDLFWIAILVAVAYGTCFTLADLYISLFKSPQWIELRGNTLIFKMVFQEPLSLDAGLVERIEKKSLFQIWGFYNIRVSCPSRDITLYFLTERFGHLDNFFRELMKANPGCRVDESLISFARDGS
jgi:hypothetical protein